MVPGTGCGQTAAMFYEALPDFIVVSLIFFAAGAVKGVLGMGLPTIAMGLLGLVMPVASAAALLTVPSLVTNVWQALAGSRLAALVRRLGTMQLGIVCGTLLAPMLLPAPPEALGRQLLGACLIAYGAFGLLGRSLGALPARHEAWAGLIVGSITGVITGLTGVFVLPAVPYLQTLGLGKDGLSQALGLCFTTSTLALAAMLAYESADLRAVFAHGVARHHGYVAGPDPARIHERNAVSSLFLRRLSPAGGLADGTVNTDGQGSCTAGRISPCTTFPLSFPRNSSRTPPRPWPRCS